MNTLIINNCPGTLKSNNKTYSRACLIKLFNGRKVNHILSYNSPTYAGNLDDLFIENQKRISISGVQEKFSILLEKNKLRLIEENEQGTYILKPIPKFGKSADQMPANEHLTMQIAKQVFEIETADNAIIFFKNNEPAYITKRFDIKNNEKIAIEDFASLSGRTPQTFGVHYKYKGNYLEMFKILKKYVPTYKVEAPKLFKLILFNYIFSNGDAHFKNFSLIETSFGDFKLSPAYDLLNSQLHINDSVFALDDGLLSPDLSKGNVVAQFYKLGELSELSIKQIDKIFSDLTSNSDKAANLVANSFLSEHSKRNYLQTYQSRVNKVKNLQS